MPGSYFTGTERSGHAGTVTREPFHTLCGTFHFGSGQLAHVGQPCSTVVSIKTYMCIMKALESESYQGRLEGPRQERERKGEEGTV